jgi:hypothetical protein
VPSGVPPSVSPIAKGPFKRSLLGYRRREVDAAIETHDADLATAAERLAGAEEKIGLQRAEIESRGSELAGREARIDDLEQVATRLSERVVERERELREVRAELGGARRDGEERIGALTELMREIEGVRRQARAQATRLRLAALRDAAGLADRMAELERHPPETRERLLESLSGAIQRLGGEPAAGDDETVEIADANGRGRGLLGELFAGLIEVEIGPLTDFSQLVGFEDAARSIAATSEISVRRFSGGRATLALTLSEPVELLRELEARCDLEFRVRDTRSDRVVLDVGR